MLNDDLMLVRAYACGDSEAAFTELVARHLNLVYSVALRQVREPGLAEEVTRPCSSSWHVKPAPSATAPWWPVGSAAPPVTPAPPPTAGIGGLYAIDRP